MSSVLQALHWQKGRQFSEVIRQHKVGLVSPKGGFATHIQFELFYDTLLHFADEHVSSSIIFQ